MEEHNPIIHEENIKQIEENTKEILKMQHEEDKKKVTVKSI